MSSLSRRRFLPVTGGAVALATLPRGPWLSGQAAGRRVVLFQGDSITDAGRDRSVARPNVAGGPGTGDPLLIAAHAPPEQPTRDLQFFNPGRGGNTGPPLPA